MVWKNIQFEKPEAVSEVKEAGSKTEELTGKTWGREVGTLRSQQRWLG